MKTLLTLLVLGVCSLQALAITVYDRDQTSTRIGGYMDTEFKSTKTENTFKAHRFILQVGSRINEKIEFNSEVEYEYGGYLKSGDAGDTKGELKIEQAWVDYKAHDAFTVRTGIVLIPVGQLNIFHDSDLRDFTDRPLVNSYIIPTTWMDTGIGGHGTMELGDAELTYEGYVTNGLTHDNDYTTTKGVRNMRPNFKADTNKGKAISGRIGYQPNINTIVGFSGYRGNSKQEINAFDARYAMGQFGLKGEYATYKDGFNNEAKGYFVQGKYNVAPNLSLDGELNLLARYDSVDLGGSSTEVTRSTLGVNYRPAKQLVYKVSYQMQDDSDDNALMASVAVGF